MSLSCLSSCRVGRQPSDLLFPAIIQTQSDNFFRCTISACISPPSFHALHLPALVPFLNLTPQGCDSAQVSTPLHRHHLCCQTPLSLPQTATTHFHIKSSTVTSSCLLKAPALNGNPRGDGLSKGKAIFLHPLLSGGPAGHNEGT